MQHIDRSTGYFLWNLEQKYRDQHYHPIDDISFQNVPIININFDNQHMKQLLTFDSSMRLIKIITEKLPSNFKTGLIACYCSSEHTINGLLFIDWESCAITGLFAICTILGRCLFPTPLIIPHNASTSTITPRPFHELDDHQPLSYQISEPPVQIPQPPPPLVDIPSISPIISIRSARFVPFITGDLCFLNTLFGHGGCSSTYPCILCTIKMRDIKLIPG